MLMIFNCMHEQKSKYHLQQLAPFLRTNPDQLTYTGGIAGR